MSELHPYRGFIPTIGLEVHCQLKTTSKLFCGCPNHFGDLPNHQVCPVCLGHPGVLPVLNSQAVDFGVTFALAVGASIDPLSRFSRKQYFYPDLPKGYQISQFDQPFCVGGGIELADGEVISLARVHFEEDAGKSIHGESESFVDINRAGVPLIEIVTDPVIERVDHAVEYLKNLRAIVKYLGICDGNMQEGSFRCDANVSVRKYKEDPLGTRCEIKNLNSFRNIEKAILYEISRHIDLIEDGKEIIQETVLFDPASGKTKSMRSKADAHDYRYFPDPDLPPVDISEARICRLKKRLPELPKDRDLRYEKEFGLGVEDRRVLISEKELSDYYEEVLSHVDNRTSPKVVANWVLGEFLKVFNDSGGDYDCIPVSAKDLAELLSLIANGTLSGKLAKNVFEMMPHEKIPPGELVKKKGLSQVTDESEIDKVVLDILAKYKAQVEEYNSGKTKVFGFFVGEVMKASKGRFSPDIVNKKLRDHLDE